MFGEKERKYSVVFLMFIPVGLVAGGGGGTLVQCHHSGNGEEYRINS